MASTRSIVLKYPITSPDDGGSYLCKLNRTNGRPEIIENQFVRVECKLKNLILTNFLMIFNEEINIKII